MGQQPQEHPAQDVAWREQDDRGADFRQKKGTWDGRERGLPRTDVS